MLCLTLSLQSQLSWIECFLFKINWLALTASDYVLKTEFIVLIATDTTPTVSAVMTVHIKTTTIAISNTERHAVTTLSCTAFLFLNSSRCVRLSGVGVNTERCQRMSVYLQKYVSVCVPMLTPRCQCPHKMVPCPHRKVLTLRCHSPHKMVAVSLRKWIDWHQRLCRRVTGVLSSVTERCQCPYRKVVTDVRVSTKRCFDRCRCF